MNEEISMTVRLMKQHKETTGEKLKITEDCKRYYQHIGVWDFIQDFVEVKELTCVSTGITQI